MHMELERSSQPSLMLHELILDIYRDISLDDATLCNQGLERSIRLFNSFEPNIIIEPALKTDMLSRLVYLIRSHQFALTTNPTSRAVVVNALKNVANMVSGSPDLTKQVLSPDMIEMIVGMLNSPDLLFKNEAVFILGNAAADSGEIRDKLMESDVLSSLIKIFHSEMVAGFVNQDLGANALWALKNFYHSKPALDLDAASPILNMIFELYSTTHITPQYIPACMEAVSILGSVIVSNPTMFFGDFMQVFVMAVPLKPATVLSAIGDLILKNDDYAIKFVQHGGLQMSMSALESIKDFSIRKEIFWILGNSCSASEQVSRQIIEAGLVPYAMAALSGPQPIANEAGWVIVETVRLCNQMPALAGDFLNAGVIQGVFNLLCLTLSPLGVLTDNSIMLIIQLLGVVFTLFSCEPERVRCALSSVTPRQDIDFCITVDQLFTSLMDMEHPIITNNATVLYQSLKSSNKPSQ